MAKWDPDIVLWFRLLFAHHGRPVPRPDDSWGRDAFAEGLGYDWRAEDRVMGDALITWFPQIRDHAPPRLTNEFTHFFAGILALADWVGSDREAFDFVDEFDPTYWAAALEKARRRLQSIGLAPSNAHLAGAATWSLLSDHPEPRPAQQTVADVATSERLVILEAETGSGKTEAALWRFAQLFEAGEVEALYFAVPTRAAARQLQTRVNDALKRMFAAPAPEAILAIPGQALAGEAKGLRLPEFRTRWDDTEAARPSRWAAEHATRFLAAQIAVGTVDQVMMAGLKVKHAHLRGAAMSRALVVIDEVHASDAWMTAIQYKLVGDHISLGGQAMLMSATLGAVARAQWRGESLPSLAAAEVAPYPAVWTQSGCSPVPSEKAKQKNVAVRAQAGWSGTQAAELAIAAAHKGRTTPLTVTDTQNAKLEKSDRGWTTWGAPEGRAGATYDSPHRRRRDYLADHETRVVLRLTAGDGPALDDLAVALDHPVRPFFIGRKPCLPVSPLLVGTIEAATAYAALRSLGINGRAVWPDEGDGPEDALRHDLADLRNWNSGLHGGSRIVMEGSIA